MFRSIWNLIPGIPRSHLSGYPISSRITRAPIRQAIIPTLFNNIHTLVSPASAMASAKGSRLGLEVKPFHYTIGIDVNPEETIFYGEAQIDVVVDGNTRNVTINGHDLTIKTCTFTNKHGKTNASINTLIDSESETITFSFEEEFPVGSGKLFFEYHGILNDFMRGFYRSKLSESQYMAVTQFEPVHARSAFPCWDEPAIKATFDITLTTPKHYTALSNTPVLRETQRNDKKSVTFMRTPIMSTYLVAFVVADIAYISGTTAKGVEIRVYATKDKVDQGNFALEVALKSLPLCEKYFGIDCPLKKCDLVAVADFESGAMENWGLITFRDECILVDDKKTSTDCLHNVALTVAHEVSHQWFGNLVTMEWWTDLWLNEGFASLMEFTIVDQCYPEYNIWDEFLFTYSRGISLDALDNSHPIEVTVNRAHEVDEIFDSISYNKGSAVIRMLRDYLGTDIFREGLHTYLRKHEYANATTDDLWKSLQCVVSAKSVEDNSGDSIKAIMDSWTKQVGFPIVSVSLKGNSAYFEQNKFVTGGKKESEALWNIPLSFKCSGGEIISSLMTKKTHVVVLPDKTQWVKLNPDCIGFYRSRYTSDTLETLLANLYSPDAKFSVADRFSLQNDVFALAKAGYIPTVDFLRLMRVYRDETSHIVWGNLISAANQLAALLSYAEDTKLPGLYEEFCKEVLSGVYEILGWVTRENDSPETRMLRASVIQCLGNCGHSDAVTRAASDFEAHCLGNAIIPADLQVAVMRTAVKHGGANEVDQLKRLFKQSDNAEEQDRILHSLGATENPELILDVLEFSVGPDVRNQDLVSGLSGCCGSRVGQEEVCRFVESRWTELRGRFSQTAASTVASFVRCGYASFASHERADRCRDFFAANPTQTVARTVEQVVESVRMRADWLDRDVAGIKEFIKSTDNRKLNK